MPNSNLVFRMRTGDCNWNVMLMWQKVILFSSCCSFRIQTAPSIHDHLTMKSFFKHCILMLTCVLRECTLLKWSGMKFVSVVGSDACMLCVLYVLFRILIDQCLQSIFNFFAFRFQCQFNIGWCVKQMLEPSTFFTCLISLWRSLGLSASIPLGLKSTMTQLCDRTQRQPYPQQLHLANMSSDSGWPARKIFFDVFEGSQIGVSTRIRPFFWILCLWCTIVLGTTN